MRNNYPNDISHEQFELIRPLLENVRRKTSPRRIDLYEVFCAVLYLWRTAHSYWAIWSEPREGGSLLEQALKKSGWRGPNETGAQRLQHAPDRGCAECEKYGHSWPERVGRWQEGVRYQAPYCCRYARVAACHCGDDSGSN